MTPSPELKAWLEQREELLKLKRRFAEEGGHIMLKDNSYDPEELDEPLRTEAKAYFKEQEHLKA